MLFRSKVGFLGDVNLSHSASQTSTSPAAQSLTLRYSTSPTQKSNVLEVDLNIERINNFIKKIKPDLIIHTAAAKGANRSNSDPKKFIDVNSFGTLNICESMRINKVKKLVYISSCSFYKRKKTEIFEDDSISNNTPYGFGKYIGELIVNYYSNKYLINSIALRPNLITGNKLKQDNLFFDIIKEVTTKGTATIFGNGLHEREFIHPNDIYLAIKMWIKKKNKEKKKLNML